MRLANRLGAARSLAPAGLLALVCLAVFFGLASAILPGWFIFSVLLVPAVAVLLIVRPEYALIALVALTCGLIHPAFVPRIPLLGGSVAAADATLAMLAAYAVWMFAAHEGKVEATRVAGIRLLAVALGLFGVSFLIAVPMSLWVRELNPAWVLGEARRLLYLLALPIAVLILRQRERQIRFVVGIVVLGCLFSVGQVLQGVLDIKVFGSGHSSELETLGRQEYGTTRSLTYGIGVIVYALLLTVGAYILGIIRKPLFFTVAGLLLLGIFLSFGRTTFAVVAVCVIMVVSWLNLRKLPQLAGWLVLLVAIGSVTASLWKPESLAAAYYRMTTISSEVEYGYSAQWRIWEAEAMLPHIQRHPLVGLGLGADYKGQSRSSVSRELNSTELNRYVHNAYLYMAGKMGLPALAFFLLAIAAIFSMGRRSAKSGASACTRVIGAAGAAMMIDFLLASVTEPHFMVDYSLVIIAIVGAVVVLNAQHARAAVPAAANKGKLRIAARLPS